MTVMQQFFDAHIVKKPIGILQDISVIDETFIFYVDFVILDCEVDFEVLTILERPFLVIGRALVDMDKGQILFKLNNIDIKVVSIVNLIMKE